jgi:phage terminase large subunit-like protein
MYCLVADGEARAEVYAAASKKDQAMILFRDAVAMWQQSPALSKRIRASGGNPVWNLYDVKSSSFFRPISSDEGQSGPRPSCALCDEVHEHRDGRTIEMLERGFKWRRQPLLVMITNSGSDRNSVCFQEHEHAVKVAHGEVDDDRTFSFVCSLDEGDDPLNDPECWPKANPLLDVTITRQYLADVVKQAKAIPGKLNNILRLHFCMWTDADTAWMARGTLEPCLADFDPAEHAGEPVFVGCDLSSAQDLTALAFVVPTGVDAENRPTFDAWVEAWTPGDTLNERALRDKAPYDVWHREGWLHAPPGRLVRFDFVAARLVELGADFDVQSVAYDRYAFARFAEELDALGFDRPVVEHPQGGKRRAKESGLWMPGSLKELERLILERRLRIRKSPVIVSAVMSAALETDAFENAWFSKRKATNRIDAVVALAMAVGSATQGLEPVAVSPWDIDAETLGWLSPDHVAVFAEI